MSNINSSLLNILNVASATCSSDNESQCFLPCAWMRGGGEGEHGNYTAAGSRALLGLST